MLEIKCALLSSHPPQPVSPLYAEVSSVPTMMVVSGQVVYGVDPKIRDLTEHDPRDGGTGREPPTPCLVLHVARKMLKPQVRGGSGGSRSSLRGSGPTTDVSPNRRESHPQSQLETGGLGPRHLDHTPTPRAGLPTAELRDLGASDQGPRFRVLTPSRPASPPAPPSRRRRAPSPRRRPSLPRPRRRPPPLPDASRRRRPGRPRPPSLLISLPLPFPPPARERRRGTSSGSAYCAPPPSPSSAPSALAHRRATPTRGERGGALRGRASPCAGGAPSARSEAAHRRRRRRRRYRGPFGPRPPRPCSAWPTASSSASSAVLRRCCHGPEPACRPGLSAQAPCKVPRAPYFGRRALRADGGASGPDATRDGDDDDDDADPVHSRPTRARPPSSDPALTVTDVDGLAWGGPPRPLPPPPGLGA